MPNDGGLLELSHAYWDLVTRSKMTYTDWCAQPENRPTRFERELYEEMLEEMTNEVIAVLEKP